MITNSIYAEAIILFLSTSSDITLNFAIWLTSLKVWQNNILQGARFVFAFCESLNSRIVLPSRIQSNRQCLAHWVGTKLNSIDTNNWFAQIWRFAYKSFMHYSFRCVKTIEGSPTMSSRVVSSNSSSDSVKRSTFQSVELCKQILAIFGSVHPSFSIIIPLLW